MKLLDCMRQEEGKEGKSNDKGWEEWEVLELVVVLMLVLVVHSLSNRNKSSLVQSERNDNSSLPVRSPPVITSLGLWAIYCCLAFSEASSRTEREWE